MGKRIRSLLYAALLLCLLAPVPSAAQMVPSTPLSYEDCLRKRKALHEKAKEAGNKAWDIVLKLPGIAGSSPESRAWYAKADEFRAMADALKCVWNPGKGEQSGKEKAADKMVDALARQGLKSTPADIRTYIKDQLGIVQTHNSHLMEKVKAVERGIDTVTVAPAPPVQHERSPPVRPSPLAGFDCSGSIGSERTQICGYRDGDALPGRSIGLQIWSGRTMCREVEGEGIVFTRTVSGMLRCTASSCLGSLPGAILSFAHQCWWRHSRGR